MNCSPDLSAEHYMSRSVLEEIGSKVAIDGVPWLPAGERREVGINSLTAKILCRRHNSALSPLDATAGEFFRTLRQIHVDLQRRSLSRKRNFVLMSGEIIELWMLKVACGLFYSRNAAKGGARLIDDHALNEQRVQDALCDRRWADGCGLYMKAPQGHRVPVMDSIAMAPLSSISGKWIVGGGLIITGLEFELIFDPIGANIESLLAEGWVHRPSELFFGIDKRSHSIGLTWEPGTPPKSVRMINKLQRRAQPVTRRM